MYQKKPKQNLAAVRRMAAKKGAQIQFQIDVANEEEWNKLLERTGLIVVDVYSEWCGPCTAMISSLKKLKLEISNDYLHFAIAKSNSIEVLRRFQNKSEPTWMFIGGGKLVNLMFGVDAPGLIRVIKEELIKEIDVLEGRAERKWLPFEELTEAEKEREAFIRKKNEEKELLQLQKLTEKKNIIRERSLGKLAKLLPNHTCIVYLPHMITADGTCLIAQKMMYLSDTVSAVLVDQIYCQLDKAAISQVFYKCPVFEKIPHCIKTSLEEKQVLVTLLQTVIIEETGDVLSPRLPMQMDSQTIEQKMCKLVYGNDNSNVYTDESVAYEFIVENENGEKLPPMWTPTNPISKAAAIEILFPRKVEAIGYVPEELPPEQLIIIYDASKAVDVMEIIREHEADVCRIGFFDSIDPRNAKLVCKSYDQFRELPEEQTKNVKFVVALKKHDTDDLLLEFSQVIPFYISPNEKVGTEESEHFFPFDYDTEEEEAVIFFRNRDETADNNEENVSVDDNVPTESVR